MREISVKNYYSYVLNLYCKFINRMFGILVPYFLRLTVLLDKFFVSVLVAVHFDY